MRFVKIIFVLVAVFSVEARADLFGFAAFTDKSGQSSVIAPQLCIDVTDLGGSQVLFTFYNNVVDPYLALSPLTGSITDVYFEDFQEGLLSSIASIDNGDPGVQFSQGASPAELPFNDLLEPDFVTTGGLSVDSDGPVKDNGVDVGEYLGIVFGLQPGRTYDEVIAALYQGFMDPLAGESLRIGITVMGIDGGANDQFICVPTPGAVFLGILGLGAVGIKLRKFT